MIFVVKTRSKVGLWIVGLATPVALALRYGPVWIFKRGGERPSGPGGRPAGSGRGTWKKAGLWVLGVVVALWLILRFGLSPVVKWQANKKLAALDDYVGHVDGATLQPWRASVGFTGLTLVQRGSKAAVPLVAIKSIEAHYSWKALFHGGFVGDVVLNQPVIHYVKPPKGKPTAGPQPKPKTAAKAAKKGVEKAQAQTTDYINKLEIYDGRLELEDDEVRPGYTMSIHDLRATAYNLGSKPGLKKQETSATLAGVPLEHGRIFLGIKADALAPKPTFEYQLSISSMSVPDLNPWLRKTLGIRAKAGVLNFYSEAKSKEGQAVGYVEPLLVGLDLGTPKRESIGAKIESEAEKAVAKVLRNPLKNQIGTRVSFSGNINNPKVKIWQGVLDLMSNAFVKALSPGLRGVVDLNKGLKG